jgi:hypothetical protein
VHEDVRRAGDEERVELGQRSGVVGERRAPASRVRPHGRRPVRRRAGAVQARRELPEHLQARVERGAGGIQRRARQDLVHQHGQPAVAHVDELGNRARRLPERERSGFEAQLRLLGVAARVDLRDDGPAAPAGGADERDVAAAEHPRLPQAPRRDRILQPPHDVGGGGVEVQVRPEAPPQRDEPVGGGASGAHTVRPAGVTVPRSPAGPPAARRAGPSRRRAGCRRRASLARVDAVEEPGQARSADGVRAAHVVVADLDVEGLVVAPRDRAGVLHRRRLPPATAGRGIRRSSQGRQGPPRTGLDAALTQRGYGRSRVSPGRLLERPQRSCSWRRSSRAWPCRVATASAARRRRRGPLRPPRRPRRRTPRPPTRPRPAPSGSSSWSGGGRAAGVVGPPPASQRRGRRRRRGARGPSGCCAGRPPRPAASVEAAPPGYAVPLDVHVVDPRAYARVTGDPAVRRLRGGRVLLSASSRGCATCGTGTA